MLKAEDQEGNDEMVELVGHFTLVESKELEVDRGRGIRGDEEGQKVLLVDPLEGEREDGERDRFVLNRRKMIKKKKKKKRSFMLTY